jgi:hypothetical protein
VNQDAQNCFIPRSHLFFLFLFVFARFPKFTTSAVYTTIHFCSGCLSSASRPIAPFDAFALIPTRAL